MRYPKFFYYFVLVLFGCTNNEIDALSRDLNKNQIAEFSYKVGGFGTFQCNPVIGQSILKEWLRSVKEAEIASWPSPDNYLELLFKNGNKYSIRVFIGSDSLEYSALHTNGVYTGAKLDIERACLGAKDT